jgi:hypothetical protein
VSTASVFHIILAKKKIGEMSLSQEKRMKLNGYFRKELAYIHWQRKESLEEKLKGKSKDDLRVDEDYLNRLEKKTKKEMRGYGYTNPEIEGLEKSAMFFGEMSFRVMHREEYRKEQKAIGVSEAATEKAIERASNSVFEVGESFLLDW